LAENPLLPNAELRSLRTWTKRAITLIGKAPKTATPALEAGSKPAFYAATGLQLRSGDILLAPMADRVAATLVAPKVDTSAERVSTLEPSLSTDHFHLAAGLAYGLKRASTDRLVLTLFQSGLSTAKWAAAMTWAQTDLLPVIFAIADPSGPDAFRPDAAAKPDTLTWTSLQKLTGKLKLPVLSVDGEDAVAVYRVMQESVLRARSGGGPAVLWAMLPRPEELSSRRDPAASPLARLERYMKTRKVPFQ
jgi:hypothetical protein